MAPAALGSEKKPRQDSSPQETRRRGGVLLMSTGGKNGQMTYMWITVGSALGGAFRYWCSGVAARLIGETFPWGTLLVNIFGSFVIGLFFTLTGPDGRLLVSSDMRLFVM